MPVIPFVFRSAADRYRESAELGRFSVPERRDRPHGAAIELAFVRFRGTAPDPGPPLVYLAGGPGGSAIEEGRDEAMFRWFMALRAAGDVILLEQRGTEHAQPCLRGAVRWDLPLDQPLDRATIVTVARERSLQLAAFWAERGVDLAGYTTIESADDVEALRVVLGAERINLLGASYGSHLALATIRRHGEHVSRAVIGLVEGPDHTYKLPSTVQTCLEDVGAAIREDPGVAGMMPDLVGALAELLARLERHPQSLLVETASGEVRVVVGPFDLQLAVSGWLGDAQFVARLPGLAKTMLEGDFAWLAAEAVEMRQRWFGNAMFWHMDCASGGSSERRERIAREAPTTLLGDAINMPFPDVCEAWGCPDLGPAFRAPIVSTVPTLFFSGALDVRTPIANAVEVAEGFAHSHHLTVDALAHDYPVDPETTAAIVAFLRGEPVQIDRVERPFAFVPSVA